MSNFAELGVNAKYVKALTEMGIKKPTEIQIAAIPFLMTKGTDFIGQAQTGTGKTAAFGLPILHSINPDKEGIQALILCPTRELGQQIAKQLFKFTKYIDKKIFTECVYGGHKIDEQIAALRRPTHIVVATPGRLIDLLDRKALSIDGIRTLVLDEADEMLSMGFKDELDKILQQTNGKRKTWLFSATMPQTIQRIIKTYMDPSAYKVDLSTKQVMNKDIEHVYVQCEIPEKPEVLIKFIQQNKEGQGIVFCRTKAGAQNLSQQLFGKGITADAIHGDLKQKERDKVMRAFKGKKINVLVATDIAARGLDIKDLSFVVHYQQPEKSEYYTHRSGRTARAGQTGISLNIIIPGELPQLEEMASKLGFKLSKAKFD